jgi:hypothetical protein
MSCGLTGKGEIMDEKEGIKAIIFLQSLAGIEETPEDAKIGWHQMSHREKCFTLALYRTLDGEDNE